MAFTSWVLAPLMTGFLGALNIEIMGKHQDNGMHLVCIRFSFTFMHSHVGSRLRFSFVRPCIPLYGARLGNCARLARVLHLPYLVGSLRLTSMKTSRCLCAHALPWPAPKKTNATFLARDFFCVFNIPLAIRHLWPYFNTWNLSATRGEVLWDHGLWCFLRILPSSTAPSLPCPSPRSTFFLTSCGLHCRSAGLPSVEFPCFNVMSNSFLTLISWSFNSLQFPIWCEFSPCVQGCVLGFALVFNIPTQVCPLNSTILLFCIVPHRLDLTLNAHSSILNCALRVWPWCPVVVRVYPCTLSNSYNYATTDTMLLLPPCDLLIAIIVGRYQFCINRKCGGVSCLWLIFQGTRKFSVQLHPLPSP